MRVAKNVALAFTVVCLLAAAGSMLSSTGLTFCAGDCTTVDCGSPAFPKTLIDFGDLEEGGAGVGNAANCAGVPSASVALYCVLLAMVGLGVVAVTTRRKAVDHPPPTSRTELNDTTRSTSRPPA